MKYYLTTNKSPDKFFTVSKYGNDVLVDWAHYFDNFLESLDMEYKNLKYFIPTKSINTKAFILVFFFKTLNVK